MAGVSIPGEAKCGICLEPFRNPRRLPCQHSFCEDCLESWITNNKDNTTGLLCPCCKAVTPIPTEGACRFPKADRMATVRVNIY